MKLIEMKTDIEDARLRIKSALYALNQNSVFPADIDLAIDRLEWALIYLQQFKANIEEEKPE